MLITTVTRSLEHYLVCFKILETYVLIGKEAFMSVRECAHTSRSLVSSHTGRDHVLESRHTQLK